VQQKGKGKSKKSRKREGRGVPAFHQKKKRKKENFTLLSQILGGSTKGKERINNKTKMREGGGSTGAGDKATGRKKKRVPSAVVERVGKIGGNKNQPGLNKNAAMAIRGSPGKENVHFFINKKARKRNYKVRHGRRGEGLEPRSHTTWEEKEAWAET